MLISSSDDSLSPAYTATESGMQSANRQLRSNLLQPEPLGNPWRGTEAASRPRSEVTAGLNQFHAAPLSPLKQRDNQALRLLFDRQDMESIERDVDQCLLLLWPEPCWEDDSFEFLREYL